MIDPDKKVDEARKKRKSVYQSRETPEHFGAEGDEYIERTANRKDVKNTLPEDIKNTEENIAPCVGKNKE